jgi:polyhydroxyalkanoate synthesis regulator phasin
MDPKKVTKQTFDFYKSTFENAYNATTMLQEQSHKMIDMYLDQTQGFPEEGKKAVQEWLNAYKKGNQDFKSAVDESIKKVEDFFTEAAKTAK